MLAELRNTDQILKMHYTALLILKLQKQLIPIE
jgi:hypothetical protein